MGWLAGVGVVVTDWGGRIFLLLIFEILAKGGKKEESESRGRALINL